MTAQAALLQVAVALSSHSWDLMPAAVTWNETSSFCSWHGVGCCASLRGSSQDPPHVVFLQQSNLAVPCEKDADVKALELQSLQIVADSLPWDALREVSSLAVLNVSYNPFLRGDVLTSSGLPSSLSILDARGTQLSVRDKSGEGQGLAHGLYASMEFEPYVVEKPGMHPRENLRCQYIFSQESGTLILIDAEHIPGDACHCQVSGYKRMPNEAYCIRAPEFTAVNITFLGAKGKYAPGDLPPGVAKLVTGHASPYVTMVMTDVEGSTRLWEWDSHAMAKAITMHETLMRKLMRRYSGYEVAAEGDAFIVAFHSVTDAIQWAMHSQTALLDCMWPEAFESKEVLSCARNVSCGDQLIFSGLRVRMAIESGPVTTRSADELTGRLRIEGPMCSILEALADTGDGGQCIIGQECMRLLSKSNEKYSPAPFLSRHLARYKLLYTGNSPVLQDLSAAEWQTGQVRILTAQAKRSTAGDASYVSKEKQALWQIPVRVYLISTQLFQHQGVVNYLFHKATCGCFTSQQWWRRASLTEHSTSSLLHDARRRSTDYGAPCIMHMGDYLMGLNSVSEMLPSSVYQAFPPHLLVRAFYVQRALSGVGAVRSPAFLCHPLVSAESVDAHLISHQIGQCLCAVLQECQSGCLGTLPQFTPSGRTLHLSWCPGQSSLTCTVHSARLSASVLMCVCSYVHLISGAISQKAPAQVSDAINFSVGLQRCLLAVNWDAFEGVVPALWRAPHMSAAPCVRTAIDHAIAQGIVRTPATGRVFAVGPHINKVVAMAHAAAPGECMLSQAAVDTWREELQVNSFDGGNPFAHLLPPKTSMNRESVQPYLDFLAHCASITSNTGQDISDESPFGGGEHDVSLGVHDQADEGSSTLLRILPDVDHVAETSLRNSALECVHGCGAASRRQLQADLDATSQHCVGEYEHSQGLRGERILGHAKDHAVAKQDAQESTQESTQLVHHTAPVKMQSVVATYDDSTEEAATNLGQGLHTAAACKLSACGSEHMMFEHRKALTADERASHSFRGWRGPTDEAQRGITHEMDMKFPDVPDPPAGPGGTCQVLQTHMESDLLVDMGGDADESVFDASGAISQLLYTGSENSANLAPFGSVSRRTSVGSSKFWGANSERGHPVHGTRTLRHKARYKHKAHLLGAISHPFKQLSQRMKKWHRRVWGAQHSYRMVDTIAGVKTRESMLLGWQQRPGMECVIAPAGTQQSCVESPETLVSQKCYQSISTTAAGPLPQANRDGNPEWSVKVLQGCGDLDLPDPPMRLLTGGDEGRMIFPQGDRASLPQHSPPLLVPKYSTLLGIEYQFLLQHKYISEGMLVLHHGHTFRVPGVDDKVVTYSLAAGNMLPLVQLIHAAPDLATLPVADVQSSPRCLYTLAYSPPSNLGHITKAMKRILDSAPTQVSRVGQGCMDGFGNLDMLDNHQGLGWKNRP